MKYFSSGNSGIALANSVEITKCLNYVLIARYTNTNTTKHVCNFFRLRLPRLLFCSRQQIIGILKEHEAGTLVSELCRNHSVSDASIYKWKAKFGGMDVSEAKRLKTLGDENTKLTCLLAEAMLYNAALKDLL